jgi:predicted metal-dependent peptidase
MRAMIRYMVEVQGRGDRRRTWRREHRRWGDILPGRIRPEARGCRIIVDASGSMQNETLAQFLGGVAATPELRHSDAIVFDTEVVGPVPLTSVIGVRDKIASRGGGTAFQPPAKHRVPGLTAVWVTDGMSCDGWPSPHDGPEVWAITPGGTRPPDGHGVVLAWDDARA